MESKMFTAVARTTRPHLQVIEKSPNELCFVVYTGDVKLIALKVNVCELLVRLPVVIKAKVNYA
jgi:hypothetical protein